MIVGQAISGRLAEFYQFASQSYQTVRLMANTAAAIRQLEQTVIRLKGEVDQRSGSLNALENELGAMEAVVRDFIKKYKQSQNEEEIKDEDRVIRKPTEDVDYEDSPPYVLVFHGLDMDWMEEVSDFDFLYKQSLRCLNIAFPDSFY